MYLLKLHVFSKILHFLIPKYWLAIMFLIAEIKGIN